MITFMLSIIFAIFAILIVILLIKHYTDPSFRKGVQLLVEHHEKKTEKRNTGLSDHDLMAWMEDNPDDGSEEWLDKFSKLIPSSDSDTNYDILEDIIYELEEYSENEDSIELPIRGINFRSLTNDNIGSFDGYIKTEINNRYDKYAIGVYGSDDTHFGFIEKGQQKLYNIIENGSGFIDGILDISSFIDSDTGTERFKGTITIYKTELIK